MRVEHRKILAPAGQRKDPERVDQRKDPARAGRRRDRAQVGRRKDQARVVGHPKTPETMGTTTGMDRARLDGITTSL